MKPLRQFFRLSVIFVWLCACSRSGPTPKDATRLRRATGAENLLQWVPLEGLSAFAEIDLSRMRTNGVLMPLLGSVAGRVDGESMDAMSQADALIIASYGVGANAERLVIFETQNWANPKGRRISEGIGALGSSKRVDMAVALAYAPGNHVGSDDSWMALRAKPMPDKASDASLRFVAQLNFDQRVQLARLFEWSEVPTSLSLWGDVVDDAAVVCDLTSSDSKAAQGLARSLVKLKSASARAPEIRRLGIARDLANAEVRVSGIHVLLTLVIAPKRLKAMVSALSPQDEAAP